jgi:putative ABC transport system permease protein
VWRNYLTVTLRVMLADRFFTFVNLLGLSIGIASVIVIFLHVTDAFSHDRWLPDHEALYRIDTVETTPGREPLNIARAPGPLRDALLQDLPEIEAISRAYTAPASVVREGQPFNEDILVADPNFFSLMGLPFAVGEPNQALRNTASIALSGRAAEKYFGDGEAVGERLTILAPEPRDFVVSAVFETLPRNSHMVFDIVIPFDGYFPANTEEIASIPDNWGGAYFFTYARLKDGADVAAIERRLPGFVDRALPQWLTGLLSIPPHEFYQFRFVPVEDVHFDGGPIGAMKPPASRTTLFALSTVALLILVIASINFANLTTARSTLRAREVALRKVVGAKRRQILVQFLGEAVLLTALAGLIGLSLVELTLPYLAGLLGLSVSLPLQNGWQFWAALVFVLLVTAIVTGLYPSVIISRIRPASVLNRSSAARSGSLVREVLVVAQFAISIALIAATTVMLLQMRFARDADLGFDSKNVLLVRMPEGSRLEALAATFKEAVLRNPDVVEATLSSSAPSDVSEDNVSIQQPGEAKPVQLGFHIVDSDFFRTYGVEPLSGRTSSMRQAQSDGEGAAPVVINQAALERLGFTGADEAVGEVIRTSSSAYTIVGVVPDIHFRSLHEPVRDEMYMLSDDAGGVLSIRFRTDDLPGFVASMDRLWRERVPGHDIDSAFLDDSLDALYERERMQARLFGIFSGLAILLSCLGLLAMAAFAVQRRAKEIAIRKVLGARTRDVVGLLLWDFARPVLIASLIALPTAWWAMRDWLNGFATRIDLGPAPFLAAALVAFTIAIVTIGGHALRVARANPIHALRYE